MKPLTIDEIMNWDQPGHGDFKFRAWDLELKCMTYFTLKDTSHHHAFITYHDDDYKRLRFMQCLGTQDRNKKDYYEGDIALINGRMKTRVLSVITYSHCPGGPGFEGSWGINKTSRGIGYPDGFGIIKGNVFETPELLDQVCKTTVAKENR